ncbi:MAG: tetratricopeptide repeat protein [Candidatus Desantisbacteria bacterium]
MRAYHGLGDAYRDKGEWDLALYYWKEAVRLKPNQFSEVHSNMGNIYRMKDQGAIAIKEYKNALKINPDNVEAHYGLAAALEELGQIEGALEHYNLFINKASESYKQEVEEAKRHIKVLESQRKYE